MYLTEVEMELSPDLFRVVLEYYSEDLVCYDLKPNITSCRQGMVISNDHDILDCTRVCQSYVYDIIESFYTNPVEIVSPTPEFPEVRLHVARYTFKVVGNEVPQLESQLTKLDTEAKRMFEQGLGVTSDFKARCRINHIQTPYLTLLLELPTTTVFSLKLHRILEDVVDIIRLQEMVKLLLHSKLPLGVQLIPSSGSLHNSELLVPEILEGADWKWWSWGTLRTSIEL